MRLAPSSKTTYNKQYPSPPEGLMKRTLPWLLLILGAAFLLGAIASWVDTFTSTDPAGFGETVRNWLATLIALATLTISLINLLKKPSSPTETNKITNIGDDSKTTTGDDSPIVQGPYIKQQVVYQTPPPVPPSPYPTPHQLPAPNENFTGREKERNELLEKIQTGGVTITSIQGMGGIGKTALALILADILTPQYPDGQIFLDLQGVDKQGALTPADAMRHVIVSFEPTIKLPDEPQQLAALYRTILNGKKVLLLWDNVLDKEQVQPLLVKGCLTLVTSRQHFTLPGLEVLELTTLGKKDARDLIRKIVPSIKAKDADEIASICGNLPLAITVSASTVAERHDLAPERYVKRLKNAQARLDLVDASIRLSYDLLKDDCKLRFRQLGVFPAPFDKNAVQALWQIDETETDLVLGQLMKYSLLNFETKSSRYWQHDLLRHFAIARLKTQEEYRSFLAYSQHYFSALETAEDMFVQGGENILKGLELFDLEWMHISSAQAWASKNISKFDSAAKLCNHRRVINCLHLRLHPCKRIEWFEHSLKASRLLMDRQAEGVQLSSIGQSYLDLGEIHTAIDFYEKALMIKRELRDRLGEGKDLGSLGTAFASLGELSKAISYHEQHLAIACEIGDRQGEGNALGNLGSAYDTLGEHHKAIEFHNRALLIVREIGDRRGESTNLGNLGNAYFAIGDIHKAIVLHTEALAIDQEIGDRRGESADLGNLANAYVDLGNLEKAITYYKKALEIERTIGDKRGEGIDLGNLGLAYVKTGNARKAVDCCEQFLSIARETGDRAAESHALGSLGIVYDDLKELSKAVECYTQCIAISHEIGDRHCETMASWNLGEIYEKMGQTKEAISAKQILVNYEREIGHPDAEEHAQEVEELKKKLQ